MTAATSDRDYHDGDICVHCNLRLANIPDPTRPLEPSSDGKADTYQGILVHDRTGSPFCDPSDRGSERTDAHDCYDYAGLDETGYSCVWYCVRCGDTLQVGGRTHPEGLERARPTKPTDDHNCDDHATHVDYGYMCVWYCAKCDTTLYRARRAHPPEERSNDDELDGAVNRIRKGTNHG